MINEEDTAKLGGVVVREDVEAIKLIKNTKGYNWEIKMLGLDVDKLNSKNEEMIKKFGSDVISA